jgi:hypothetical protein
VRDDRVLGDSFDREDGEDWGTYVQRSARHYREVLKAEQSHWDDGTFPHHDPTLILYFCLTTANQEEWNEFESKCQ